MPINHCNFILWPILRI